jgi:DNA adenine methylase
MKPFFCRVGNKYRIVKKFLLPLIPEHKIYIEPFAGSAALLWGKPPSEIEVINDLDKELIQDYRLLKKAPTHINIPEFKNLREANEFYENASNTPTERLIKSLLRRCGTFACTGFDKIYKIPLTKLNKIDDYKNRFKHVKIFNSSYEKMFDKFDSVDSFFYVDPPYENTESGVGYKNIDLEELKNRLLSLRGKWLLSINDSPNIRRMFKQREIKITPILIRARTNTRQNTIGSKDRKELLIRNY